MYFNTTCTRPLKPLLRNIHIPDAMGKMGHDVASITQRRLRLERQSIAMAQRAEVITLSSM